MMRRRTFVAAAVGSALCGAARTAAHAARHERATADRWRVIDTHLHIFNAALNLPAHFGGRARRWATAEKTIAALRRGGVAKAFLITYTARDIASQVADPERSAPVYSKAYMVTAWQRHRDLFYWFPDHVDPSRGGYLQALERDLGKGASGVKILSAFHGFLPDNPGFMPVYELCRRYRKPVIIDGSFWYFQHMPPRKEPPARQKEAMHYAGYAKTLRTVFRAFPDVPFSLAHAGTARTMADYKEIYKLLGEHPNASCDVAAALGYGPSWLERLVREVGAEKVMYGTDWPYWSSGLDSYLTGARRWTMIANECAGLSDEQKRCILAGNAERFLKFELPGAACKETHTGRQMRERAVALHRDSIVVVLHDHNPIGPDVARMRAGGVTAKVYQVGVDVEIGAAYRASGPVRAGWTAKTLAAMDRARREIEAAGEQALLATSCNHILQAKRENKVAFLLGVEGAKLLEGQIERLDVFYRRGLRQLQLRWAVPNQVVEKTSLTEFGRRLVKRCNRLGVIIDLTHIPLRAFYEVLELSEKPSIVSHSVPLRAPSGGGDRLDDRQLRALASRGGLLGIHFYSSYLGLHPTPERVVEQIDYVVDRVGVDTVAIGADFFPSQGRWREFQHAQGTRHMAWAVPDIGHLVQVTEALLARNYRETDIKQILGGNFLRLCKKVFGG